MSLKSLQALGTSRYSRGSAVWWMVLWTTAMALCALIAARWAIPAYETRLGKVVAERIVSLGIDIDHLPDIKVSGRRVTLSGTADNASALRNMVAVTRTLPFVDIDNRLSVGQRAGNPSMDTAPDPATGLAAADQANEPSLVASTAEMPGEIEADSTTLAGAETAVGKPTDSLIESTAEDAVKDSVPSGSPRANSSDAPAPELAAAAADIPVGQSDAERTLALLDSDTTQPSLEKPITNPPDRPGDSREALAEQARSIRKPILSIDIDDSMLNLSGELAAEDTVDSIIDMTLDKLDLDYVNNRLSRSASVEQAPWIDIVPDLLAALSELDAAEMTINGKQVMVAGTAGDAATEQRVIGQLLNHVGQMALVERIRVAKDEQTDAAAESMAESLAEDRREIPDTAARSIDPTRPALSRDSLALATELDKLPVNDIGYDPQLGAITGQSLAVVDRIAELLKQYPDIEVSIDGHYGDAADADSNLEISQNWSNAVREQLVEHGVSIYRLRARGYGDGIPSTTRGSTASSRIEFTITD